MSEPKTAFVLAGGGSLGAVQVGMLKALAAHEVVPDLVVGASVGAINGAHYAGDPTVSGVEKLVSIWKKIRRRDVFPFSPVGGIEALLGLRNHLVDPRGLRKLVESEMTFTRMEDAKIPFHAVATDILSGAEVVLSRGPVPDAVMASSAIPLVYPPVTVGGRHLMDGGVANITPVSTAVDLGAERIVVLHTGHT